MSALGLKRDGTDTVGKRADGQPNKICNWDGSKGDSTGVSLLGMGIDAQYKKQNMIHFYTKFEPTTINGYPAVNTTKANDEKDGRTSLTIGLNDHESADVQVIARTPGEAKKITDTVAKTIVDTARAGGK